MITLGCSQARDSATLSMVLFKPQRRKYRLRGSTDTGSGKFLWEQSGNDPNVGTMANVRALVSNVVPNNVAQGTTANTSPVVYCDWSDLIVAFWTPFEFLIDPYTDGKSGRINVVSASFGDLSLRHIQSAAVLSGVTG